MRKGQIFSLDFLLGVMLIIVIIGSLTQAMDVTAFTAKQNRADYELFVAGDIATEILVSSPKSTCEVVASHTAPWDGVALKGYEALPNCVDMAKLDNVLKKDDLLLSGEYDCLITTENFPRMGVAGSEFVVPVSGCNSNRNNVPNMASNTVYKGRRQVIINARAVAGHSRGYHVLSKSEIINCIKGESCEVAIYNPDAPYFINLYVWRTP